MLKRRLRKGFIVSQRSKMTGLRCSISPLIGEGVLIGDSAAMGLLHDLRNRAARTQLAGDPLKQRCARRHLPFPKRWPLLLADEPIE
jgi:hypothetical protein